jgi:hypothetical protein
MVELMGVLLATSACGSEPSAAGALTMEEAPDELVECESVRAYTAALGAATIRCLGSFSPDTYFVDEGGILRENFDACTRPGAGEALRDIQDLLVLQEPEAEFPAARRCMPEAYRVWAERFTGAGNHACPTWDVVSSRGDATPETARQAARFFDFDHMLATGREIALGEPALHRDFIYEVRFPASRSAQPCGDALSCAQNCARAFPGWHVGFENGRFVGDPSWWVENEYAYPNSPYMVPGYYHPMSFYGPPPGAIYGHRNRQGEACSRWAGGVSHYILGLSLWCLDPQTQTKCYTKCAGPAPSVYSGGVYH